MEGVVILDEVACSKACSKFLFSGGGKCRLEGWRTLDGIAR